MCAVLTLSRTAIVTVVMSSSLCVCCSLSCFIVYLCMLLFFLFFFFFFFSSRRRHTRSDRDWSSDVCSSDLSGSSRRLSRLPAPLLAGGAFDHRRRVPGPERDLRRAVPLRRGHFGQSRRSEEHTSELQSRSDLVCRLLLEKKKTDIGETLSRS